jgi:ribonuclease BN (tRNA processing enzyme)
MAARPGIEMNRQQASTVAVIALLCSALLFGFVPRAGSAGVQDSRNTKTQVVLLGTGTPNADPERSGASVAVVVNDKPYIIDCGPGVVRRAAAAFRNGVSALEVKRLATLFITHLHSDHTLGLADLILSPWTLERTEPLKVFGPRGTRAMTQNILNAYSEDIRIRLEGGEPSNKTGYRAETQEIKSGVVYRDQNVVVKAFPVKHGAWDEAFGYRFETADRTIVISGDCSPSESVIDNCGGCDVLVHEVYSEAGFARRPPEWQKYHSRYHTSSRELAAIANKAKPKLLVLYHQLFWGTTEADLVSEVQSRYSGKVVSGRDLDVY